MECKEDLDRQIIKSETCVSRFVELDLEIPAQRGQLTNVEGLLSLVLEDLEQDQPKRKNTDTESYDKIVEFITKGREMVEGKAFPFTVKIDDPAGNSWIEPKPDDKKGKWIRHDYIRTPEQNTALGLTDTSAADAEKFDEDNDIRPDEVHTFPASCPSCVRPCSTHMKLVDIPHFKEVVIMSTVCDACGCKLSHHRHRTQLSRRRLLTVADKSNEVKTGGAVPSKGRIITLKVEDEEDLARDILKVHLKYCPGPFSPINPNTSIVRDMRPELP